MKKNPFKTDMSSSDVEDPKPGSRVQVKLDEEDYGKLDMVEKGPPPVPFGNALQIGT
mgnify:CR=1 FL=1